VNLGIVERNEATPTGATREINRDAFDEVVLVVGGVDLAIVCFGHNGEEGVAMVAGEGFGAVGAEIGFLGYERQLVFFSKLANEFFVHVGIAADAVIEVCH